MDLRTFRIGLVALAAAFTAAFAVVVVPALASDGWDVWGGALDGFVNPYAAGYSTDVLLTWAVLAWWVWHERAEVRHGWVALVLGVVPGVAVGLAVFLLLRLRAPSVGDLARE